MFSKGIFLLPAAVPPRNQFSLPHILRLCLLGGQHRMHTTIDNRAFAARNPDCRRHRLRKLSKPHQATSLLQSMPEWNSWCCCILKVTSWVYAAITSNQWLVKRCWQGVSVLLNETRGRYINCSKHIHIHRGGGCKLPDIYSQNSSVRTVCEEGYSVNIN